MHLRDTRDLRTRVFATFATSPGGVELRKSLSMLSAALLSRSTQTQPFHPLHLPALALDTGTTGYWCECSPTPFGSAQPASLRASSLLRAPSLLSTTSFTSADRVLFVEDTCMWQFGRGLQQHEGVVSDGLRPSENPTASPNLSSQTLCSAHHAGVHTKHNRAQPFV